MKPMGQSRSAFSITAGLLSLIISLTIAYADVPRHISFQGVLKDITTDAPLAGSVELEIHFFADATGGDAIFAEEHPNVELDNGVYSIVIGDGNTISGNLNSLLGNTDIWLEQVVDSEVLAPRIKIGSTLFALKAESAEQLVKKGSSEVSVIVNDQGNVGIGTTSPLESLHILGTQNLLRLEATENLARLHIKGTGLVNEGLPYLGVEVNSLVLSGSDKSTNSAREIRFNTHDAAGGNKMVIAPEGNVGIGTANPTTKLEVAGGVNVGNTTVEKAGTIRWTGTDFEGFNGTVWVSLTGKSPPPEGMALIPPGSFQMGDNFDEGDDNELPVHSVFVNAFFMDELEVSNEQIRKVMQWALDNGKITATTTTVTNNDGDKQELLDLDWKDNENEFGLKFSNGNFIVESDRENFPCTRVTWYGAQAYCNYKSDMEGRVPAIDFSDWSVDISSNGYRLPTEAEWEKAARGGLVGHHYPWNSPTGAFDDDNNIDGSKANYSNSGDPFEEGFLNQLTPVGYYDGNQTPKGVDMANGYSLYNMAANVAEWCSDRYQIDWYDQPGATVTDTPGPPTSSQGDRRVIRGGGLRSNPLSLRCAKKGGRPPLQVSIDVGFRTVLRE